MKNKQYERYLKYLLLWVGTHNEDCYADMSPACYDEFCDNDDEPEYYDSKSFAEIIYELNFKENENE